jgi:ABC-2 type transport system permease protein
MQQSWFVAVNQVINNISVLAIFLTGAAVLREREHGNIEHLLVMPLRPFELMFAKIWANGMVVVLAAMASLFLVVKGAIGVPIAGSIPLFAWVWASICSRSRPWASCWRRSSIRCRSSGCWPSPSTSS